jgi:hypothetical protein
MTDRRTSGHETTATRSHFLYASDDAKCNSKVEADLKCKVASVKVE